MLGMYPWWAMILAFLSGFVSAISSAIFIGWIMLFRDGEEDIQFQIPQDFNTKRGTIRSSDDIARMFGAISNENLPRH